MIARRYALTKLAPGDYLLPSNDGQRLYRIARGAEPAGVLGEREVETWELFRYREPISSTSAVDTDWAAWDCVATAMRRRADAIDEALGLS